MSRVLLCAGLSAICMGPAIGCARAEVNLPAAISWGSPPPPASVPPADPGSKGDLLRENRQLRDRVAWLDNQVRKSADKNKDLEEEKREIRADMAGIAAERDRYKRRAGQ